MAIVSEKGVVHIGESLRLHAFCDRLGIDRKKVMAMKSKGLKVRRDGLYLVITGADYVEFCQSLPLA